MTRRRAPRWAHDLAWSVVGVAGTFGGVRLMEALRPDVLVDDVGAPENQVGIGELSRAYTLSAGVVVLSPLTPSARLPAGLAPVGVGVQVAAVALRVAAMRTLGGHYAHTLRVVAAQPVVRAGPYRHVRHPGYLSVLLLWLGAGLAARNAVAVMLPLVAVGKAYGHRMDAEDALLIRELPGYADYAATTPRLVPRAGRR